MTAPRVLFVKLSSLGDVIHHLPAVTDLAHARPEAIVDWAVEEAYAPLVAMHPVVRRAIAVGLRSLRSEPFSGAGWHALLDARRALRRDAYDFVIDSQGLVKSAVVAASARGTSFGLDRSSAREKLAARLYDVRIAVARDLHAVERNRRLVASVFGYSTAGTARYGLAAPASVPSWVPAHRYYVALHAASRAAKRWDDARWIELARRLAAQGLIAIYPGGTPAEREAAARLAQASRGALAAPSMTLVEAAALLAGAHRVVGVDTGLTHLAVALARPTVGIYCATDPALTGLHGGAHATNLGGPGRSPDVDAVERALGFGTALEFGATALP